MSGDEAVMIVGGGSEEVMTGGEAVRPPCNNCKIATPSLPLLLPISSLPISSCTLSRHNSLTLPLFLAAAPLHPLSSQLHHCHSIIITLLPMTTLQWSLAPLQWSLAHCLTAFYHGPRCHLLR